ncbi:lipoic acid synthase, putative [Eimeria tenella]|uniref:Lipoic acid synthase, putative n=1 Tax=Eimeria tenella TaxID=5802 RepID=U6KZA2_EIMTE|nr:lipoic acid synthase, putative [Eimeria tenella]CDJ40835.1 lipoic acid synthase, putative [Eimeria tenella]|eukprot:XP_013231585.1 lipoic acid synthase, putative [Eimeria tenella]
MLGLGETPEEVAEALLLLRAAKVDAVTLGQYLRPSRGQLGVVSFVSPQQFEVYRHLALQQGFAFAAAGPLTRSSYRAGEFFLANLLKKQNAKLQADVGELRGGPQALQGPPSAAAAAAAAAAAEQAAELAEKARQRLQHRP